MSHDDEVHARPLGYYIANFFTLMVLLVITVWVSFHHFGDTLNVAIMLTIAILKMTLVVLIFMDVWWSSRLVQVFAAAGFLWLIIMFVLTFSDFVGRDPATSIGIKRDPDSIATIMHDPAHEEAMAEIAHEEAVEGAAAHH